MLMFSPDANNDRVDVKYEVLTAIKIARLHRLRVIIPPFIIKRRKLQGIMGGGGQNHWSDPKAGV